MYRRRLLSFLYIFFCVSHFFFFFFNDTATTEIYTLSLHDALPISSVRDAHSSIMKSSVLTRILSLLSVTSILTIGRSEEHTSELQSHSDLVCRLLLEKKKNRSVDKDVARLERFEYF